MFRCYNMYIPVGWDGNSSQGEGHLYNVPWSGSFLPGEPAQEAEGERYSKLENVKSKGVQNGGKIDT